MKNYKEVNFNDLDLESYISLDEEHILITAGGKKNNNVMVTNDVLFGVLNDKPVVAIHLSGDFFTRGYVEKKGSFSLNFLSEGDQSKEVRKYLQSVSGKDEDKVKNSGLTLNIVDSIPSLDEAKYVLNCEVIYRNHLEKNDFFDNHKGTYKKEFKKNRDYAYVAEIVSAYELVEE